VLFNSFDFGVFLVVGFGIYQLLQRWRWPWLLWLLLISAFFYGCWKPWYLLLIAISTINSFSFGLLIDRARRDSLRRLLLALTVGGDLALLGVFKYGNFVLENLEALAALAGHPMKLGAVPAELPVGISFYTFQTLSYTIDIYRRKLKPTGSLLEFSVFVFFFPQLVAGPIVRASELLPQVIGTRPRLDTAAIGQGIFLILSGLSKTATAPSRPCWCCGRPTSRCTATSPATPMSPSARRCCLASSSRRTSTARSGRARRWSTGGGGTSRCRAG
jgi:alginate O-acetyltransferase complex protein AlgI